MGGWSERVMGQKGFFDVERRLEAISAKGDPLETMRKMVRWEDFRADIEAVTETKAEERNSNAGRKPYDTILKFKIVVLQSLHNLSDEQTEYLIRDRLSFMRFLDLELEDPVPDATTIWLFREALAQVGLDKAYKLIRKWDATDAAVHDSQKLDDVLDLSNTGKKVWADSAYRSLQIEADLKEKGLQSRIQRRAARNRPLSERQKSANTTRSKVRARVEHIRPPAELDGRQDRAHDRHRAGEVQDRDDEPRLQHPPAGSARAGSGCARLSALTGGLRVASCKRTDAVVRQASPIGDSSWHERSN